MPRPHQVLENEGVLRYLGQGLAPAQVEVQRPPSDVDTWRLGAHPDIVDRLWTHLGADLGEECRFLVADTVALVDPRSGLILAVAIGTQYAVRLTGKGLRAALADGYETVHEFATVGRRLDLAATFGPGWVFGRRSAREGMWLRESAGSAGSSPGVRER